MIRYIDLSEQLEEEQPCFAWFNTISWTFEKYGGIQVWESFKEFESDLLSDLRRVHTKEDIQDEMLSRFRNLYPATQTSPAQNEPS